MPPDPEAVKADLGPVIAYCERPPDYQFSFKVFRDSVVLGFTSARALRKLADTLSVLASAAVAIIADGRYEPDVVFDGTKIDYHMVITKKEPETPCESSNATPSTRPPA